MRRKWSNIIKPRDENVTVASIQMVDLSRPVSHGLRGQENARGGQTEESDTSHDCSLLQQQAYESGRAAGVEEGQAQLQTEVETERLRLSNLIAQVGLAKVSAIQQAEDDILTLALRIAKKVIHREATVDQEIVSDQVRQALHFFSTKVGVRIRAHPDEVSHLVTLFSTLLTRPDHAHPIHVEGDQTIQRGGCLIEADSIFIDATIDRQLEIIQTSLSEDNQTDEIDQSS